ncbi:hypothetical protein DFR58_11676 [Anaerobacterium chartisolvens]|uniref:4Fe-4S ferredoxin-type domain-containing protein n=1 Tax=Anaerobacterium chartisolvens TaxID=1297424 RepID=A0A369AWR3_9FIRM|nr:EFR1 family ferrodoxin [Anaerobacterium chartisolvens]RCX13840.1 hypothetical protein DFR58_11676 [Anaerobacterium chartisolvens]
MERDARKFKMVKIVYFSGTGGTARAANCIAEAFKRYGAGVVSYQLGREAIPEAGEDMLVVLYAVHACNAPEPVYKWLDALEHTARTPAAVISVSGGGEITPNTACRASSISRLVKKGYDVIYEDMIVMPSNWIVATEDSLAARLLRVLPLKADSIVKELFEGVIRRSKPSIQDRIFSKLGELEKVGARAFGKRIRVGSGCNLCGWCEKNCPQGNISVRGAAPVFGGSCIFCLKCIYGCPKKALKPGMLKFIVIKEGYDLKAVEERTRGIRLRPVEELAKGFLWKGVKDYLLSFGDIENNKG